MGRQFAKISELHLEMLINGQKRLDCTAHVAAAVLYHFIDCLVGIEWHRMSPGARTIRASVWGETYDGSCCPQE
jgi:hypothetical protein